jgi:acetyl-CoA carboxylase carboxyltransferase component
MPRYEIHYSGIIDIVSSDEDTAHKEGRALLSHMIMNGHWQITNLILGED